MKGVDEIGTLVFPHALATVASEEAYRSAGARVEETPFKPSESRTGAATVRTILGW